MFLVVGRRKEEGKIIHSGNCGRSSCRLKRRREDVSCGWAKKRRREDNTQW